MICTGPLLKRQVQSGGMTDEALICEALRLAGGENIHLIAGRVGLYRAIAQAGYDTSILERSLRAFVAQHRQEPPAQQPDRGGSRAPLTADFGAIGPTAAEVVDSSSLFVKNGTSHLANQSKI